MTELELNELLYRAVSMSEFFAGMIAGMCLVGLPLVFFWPRKSKVAEQSLATETPASTPGRASTQEAVPGLAPHQSVSPMNAEPTVGFLPTRPQPSAG